MSIYTISSAPKYCTYITTYFGSKLPMFYIGSGTISKLDHPTKPYHGSVSSKTYKDIWKQELTDNPHLFKTTILRKFYSRKAATFHECKLQKFYKVAVSEMYINKAYASKNFAGGTKQTEEHKRKIGDGNRRKKRSPRTEEHSRKISEALTGRKLPPFSEEHKQNISKAQTGKKNPPQTEEHKRKAADARRGKKRGPSTAEHGRKISEALTGRKQTEEHKRKAADARRGKKRGPYKKSMKHDDSIV